MIDPIEDILTAICQADDRFARKPMPTDVNEARQTQARKPQGVAALPVRRTYHDWAFTAPAALASGGS